MVSLSQSTEYSKYRQDLDNHYLSCQCLGDKLQQKICVETQLHNSSMHHILKLVYLNEILNGDSID